MCNFFVYSLRLCPIIRQKVIFERGKRAVLLVIQVSNAGKPVRIAGCNKNSAGGIVLAFVEEHIAFAVENCFLLGTKPLHRLIGDFDKAFGNAVSS